MRWNTDSETAYLDVSGLLSRMTGLAVFEGYEQQFQVTAAELAKRLFQCRDFEVLVAAEHGIACGMLVYYRLPFTYDLRPWVYMKGLFVLEHMRSMGVGRALMMALVEECRGQGVGTIRFDVLNSNDRAQRFHQSLGARADAAWQLYGIDISGVPGAGSA